MTWPPQSLTAPSVRHSSCVPFARPSLALRCRLMLSAAKWHACNGHRSKCFNHPPSLPSEKLIDLCSCAHAGIPHCTAADAATWSFMLSMLLRFSLSQLSLHKNMTRQSLGVDSLPSSVSLTDNLLNGKEARGSSWQLHLSGYEGFGSSDEQLCC